jgi:hypothetical protein
VTGAGGLSQSVAVTYSGVSPTIYGPSTTAPTDAGNYTAAASFTGDANHNPSNDSKNFSITKASSTTTVSVANAGYDGNPHGGAASVAGAGGLNQALAVTYTGVSGTSYGPSITAPTGAGSYTAAASFGGDSNHDPSSDSKSFSISKAPSITAVLISDGMFDGNAHGGTASVTGVGGLSQSLSITYTGISGTTYGPSSSAPVNAGSYSAAAAFAGDGNHTGSGDSKTFTIALAPSTTVVTFEPGPYVYRGSAFTATAIVTGAGGLNQGVTPVVYTGDCTNVTAANGCTALVAFAGDANHVGSMDAKSITIAKADQTIGVSGVPASANYGATFSVVSTITNVPAGPGSSNSVLLASSGGCINSDALYTMIVNVATPVCTVTATLAGNSNYNDAAPVTMYVNPSGGVIVPVHGEVHVVDPGKWGICGTNPSNGQVHAECKLWPDSIVSDGFPEAGDVVVRLYDLKNAALQSQFGRDPGPDRYRDVYTSNVGLVGTCTPKRESPTPKDNGKLAGFGEALCGAPSATDILVLAGYKDFADLKGKPRQNVDVNVVFGKKVDGGSFKSTPTNNKLNGSLRTATVPSGAGILWSDVRDIHAQKTIRKDPKDCVYGGTNTAATSCIIQYADAGKTVYTGSYLEIIYPTFTVWDEGQTKYLYPFIMNSDSEWTLDVCAAVPAGYQIVGVYDADGNLVASSDCVQAGVAGETKIVAFEVVDLLSPPPRLTTKLKIKHKGKTVNDQLDIPGKRKGRDK